MRARGEIFLLLFVFDSSMSLFAQTRGQAIFESQLLFFEISCSEKQCFSIYLLAIYDNRREEAKADAAAAAAAKAVAAEARQWEECVEGGEAYYVTAMLASVVRSLAEGPKTEMELDQVQQSRPFALR